MGLFTPAAWGPEAFATTTRRRCAGPKPLLRPWLRLGGRDAGLLSEGVPFATFPEALLPTLPEGMRSTYWRFATAGEGGVTTAPPPPGAADSESWLGDALSDRADNRDEVRFIGFSSAFCGVGDRLEGGQQHSHNHCLLSLAPIHVRPHFRSLNSFRFSWKQWRQMFRPH